MTPHVSFLTGLHALYAPMIAAASTETGASSLDLLMIAKTHGHNLGDFPEIVAALVCHGMIVRQGERYFVPSNQT